MRGDQLARQWRIIRAIEASPNGLTVTEIAHREETGFRTVYRDLEALQPAGFPYPCHAKAQSAQLCGSRKAAKDAKEGNSLNKNFKIS